MLLAIDVGNTTTEFAFFENETLKGHWRISTTKSRTTDEYRLLLRQLLMDLGIKGSCLQGIVLSCVTPPVQDALVPVFQKSYGIEPLVVSAQIDTGLKVFYNPPEALGADRLVNAFAATEKFGAPAIVVDLGTATKVEAISAKREYLGGVIAPGVGISLDALSQRAAKLPRLNLESPTRTIGTDTASAMQAGIVLGTVGEVDYLIRAVKEDMKESSPFVVATGGYAYLLRNRSREVQTVDPQLTLDGLRMLWYRQARPQS